MSKMIYITSTSLDGYVEGEAGAFDWVNPEQEFAFITELLRPIGTHLYGRRLYETMAYWGAPSHESGRRPRRSPFHER
jgi:dihydrofolate reductase